MIPQYPDFVALGIEHKQAVDAITAGFESYSDFNFTSLLCWDTDSSAQLSLLHDNLVIRMPDYTSGEPIYTILGINNIDESLHLLLSSTDSLKLVPQPVVDHMQDPSMFHVVEDRDNFDYMYNLEDLARLAGKGHKQTRNKLSQFIRTYPNHTTSTPKIDSSLDLRHFSQLFTAWALEKSKDAASTEMEKLAVQRFIKYAASLDIVYVELVVDSVLVGFSISEILPGGKTALCHFQKALISYQYADTLLTHATSQSLKSRGCQEVNWEQDLGIPGLRQAKESYRPVRYLKKYSVSLTGN
jgi:hypothetical protein